MPTLALQRLYLLPPSQWPVPKLRHRLSQLNVRSGIITDPLCLWSRTAHPASFIIKSLAQECWMQVHVPDRFYFAAVSTAVNILERHTFLIRIAGQSPSKSKDRALGTKSGLF